MNYFNKLPGFVRSPAGLEWIVFKKLPLVFLIGTLIPALPIIYFYIVDVTLSREHQQMIYQSLGLLFTVWFFVGTIAIGCVVVMIMKGPAYVADPYDLPKEDKNLESHS